jgi:hypothetical protein
MAIVLKEVQQNSNIVAQANGEQFVMNCDLDDTLALIVIGWRSLDPQKNRNPESDTSLADDTVADFVVNVIEDNPINLTLTNAGSWDHQQGILPMDGVLLTATPPATYARTLWNVDGYFPSIYMLHNTADCPGGQAIVNVATQYQVDDGGTYGGGSVSGMRPIFDGGVNMIMLRYSGLTGHTNGNHGIETTIANPAIVTSSSTLATGDLGIVVGLMKNGNQMSTGQCTDTADPCSFIAAGKCVGTEAHWMVETVVVTGSGSSISVVNPGQYEMCLDLLGLLHS